MQLRIVYSIPFLAGPLVLTPPAAPGGLIRFLSAFIHFVILFAALSVLLHMLTAAHGPAKTPAPVGKRPPPRILYFGVLFVLAFLLLAALQGLRHNTARPVFYLIMVLVPLKCLEHKLQLSRRRGAYLTACLLLYTGIGYASLNFAALTFILPALLFSLALACMTTAAAAAALLETDTPPGGAPPPAAEPQAHARKSKKKKGQAPAPPATAPPSTRGGRIFYAALILLGPSLIGFMAFVGAFPPVYAAALLCLPPAGRLAGRLNLKERTTAIPAGLARQTAALAALFTAAVLLCALVSM